MPIFNINDINASQLNPTEKAFYARRANLQDNVTAFAGGGQASATLITDHQVRVTTCATLNDSVKLPPATVPTTYDIMIVNAGAAGMNLFPSSGDAINAGAANAAVAVGVGKTAVARCVKAGLWLVNVSA